jgi:Bacteriophage T4-like portal protein (Gp20)
VANTTATSLLKYLGLVGSSGHPTGSLVPRGGTPTADQDLFRDFRESGQVANPDVWSRFNAYMRRPVTFDAMLQLWDEMAGWDLMAAALVEIVDEATQVDQNSPAKVWYQCNDREFEDDLNNMLLAVNSEEVVASQIYYLASLGNHFEKLEYAPVEGVMGMSFIHPMDVRRYWLERNKKCIGFRWTGHKPSKDSAFIHPDNRTPIERVALSDGQSVEELWYPWDILHFRRMYRLRINEHGEPIFDEAQGIYKKLRLAIDQMVVHRAQVQPDRYVINIDTKDQAPVDQMKTVQRWKQMLRSKLSFGLSNQGSTGLTSEITDPVGFQAFYNAWSLDTILWVAKPSGFEHAIEKMQGTQNIPDVYDIELLTDLFYSIIGMPRSWFGAKSGGGGGEQAMSGKALLAQDMRFLRKIKSIRAPVINNYTWLGYFHAVLKGKNIQDLDIRAMMPPIGSLEDQMKLDMLRSQAEVLDLMADVMVKYNLPKEAWVETIFKRYLHLPDEIVTLFVTSLPADIEQPAIESQQPKEPAPYTYKLIRQLEDKVRQNPQAASLIEELKSSVCGKGPDTSAKARYQRRLNERKFEYKEMEIKPKIQDWDVIISSYGKDPLHVARPGAKPTEDSTPHNGNGNGAQPLQESEKQREPAYRKFMPPRM